MQTGIVKLENGFTINLDKGLVFNSKGSQGSINNGYRVIYFNQKKKPAHNIVWAYAYNDGVLPVWIMKKGELKQCVLHLDNDRLNNHPSNLKLGTVKDNNQQAWADGLMEPTRIKVKELNKNRFKNDKEFVIRFRKGATEYNRKLSDEDIRNIDDLIFCGKIKYKDIASKYKINTSTIADIRMRRYPIYKFLGPIRVAYNKSNRRII